MRYIFVLEIVEVVEGKIYASLPTHCTLVHWFSEMDFREIVKNTTGIFRRYRPIEITLGERVFLGKHENKPAYLVSGENLFVLHQEVLREIKALGATFENQEWVGAGYNPHVSVQEGDQFFSGEKKIIRFAYLAKKADGGEGKEIVAKIKFGLY